jgi:hypothetical protein
MMMMMMRDQGKVGVMHNLIKTKLFTTF